MSDWSRDLSDALASGDPAFMRSVLARVPKEILRKAIPYLYELATSSERAGKLEEALTYYEQLLQAAADHVSAHAGHARVLLRLGRFAQALVEAHRIADLAPHSAAGYRLQAQAYEGQRDLASALAALRQAFRIEPEDQTIERHIEWLESQMRKEEVLRRMLSLDPALDVLHPDTAAATNMPFDASLFADPSMPSSFDSSGVEGLRRHLWRYSGQVSPGHAIRRLEDPVWLEAWDAALSTTSGSRVVLRGSELGFFALRALHHGAAHAHCMEAFPLDARIAAGVVQKHFLTHWHASHGATIQSLSDEERRASFEESAGRVEVTTVDRSASAEEMCECLVFAHIDHSLLGTGIVKAVRQQRARGLPSSARVLPVGATVFAMGVQWTYPGTTWRLEPINRLRWSFYPQALELGPEFWTALTEPARVCDIDFANLCEATWDISLPVTAQGRLDAIVYWFELDLGNARISSAPGSPLRCIKPAVQHTDPVDTQPGGVVDMRVKVSESRLHFRTFAAGAVQREGRLPSWYVPMLGDQRRNEAYQSAISRALAQTPAELVLDIGAGCGLLSMMAAQAGARRVVGCESDPSIAKVGQEVVALNGWDASVRLLVTDCRGMSVPQDLPQRAELAVFELFDCSLIGEGILHFLAYAREHLLLPDARYLPKAAKIRAMVIEYRLDPVWNIDASLLNAYRVGPSFINVDASKIAYRALTEPFDVFSFDFANAGPAPEERTLSLPATAKGVAGAVLFWFELALDGACSISNEPGTGSSLHWKQGLQVLPELHAASGAQLPIVARHNGSGLSFRWQQDALPKEAFSLVPPYDPRWVATNNELDQATQRLWQHCLQDPDEYAKFAAIAQCFAIDPASHDLDPTIAQRLAWMFLRD